MMLSAFNKVNSGLTVHEKIKINKVLINKVSQGLRIFQLSDIPEPFYSFLYHKLTVEECDILQNEIQRLINIELTKENHMNPRDVRRSRVKLPNNRQRPVLQCGRPIRETIISQDECVDLGIDLNTLTPEQFNIKYGVC